ncbi:MAG: hypothetical protein L3J26_06780 [Candidatus Polarisedimenticolaceae bacterium]|nr:hypothetical protein [Candidatus Polarisedimenticolaceae bacterium]
MILKASQRAYGRELAAHLLNANDNEHVEVHKISGFVADTVPAAMQEAHALSRGTRCQQYLFSLSLNPPQDTDVPISVFEDAISRVEKEIGIEGQPHVIVFHEKHGRRHAHCVWSRIDSAQMKAINLPYYKNRLMEISRELYLEQKWKLPQGFVNREMRNPLNFTQEQWQQAKRLGDSPQNTKLTLKECWVASDNKTSFSRELEKHGFYLAKGDRRDFVAIDWRGEVYSLPRWLDVKTKAIKEQLGLPEDLPSVEETKANIDQKLVGRIRSIMDEQKKKYDRRIAPILAQKKAMNEHHIKARKALEMQQDKRQRQEVLMRQSRFHKGLRGLWDRITGSHEQIKKQNEAEVYQAILRDRKEKDALISSQMRERSLPQQRLSQINLEQQESNNKIREAVFSKLPEDRIINLEHEFKPPSLSQAQDFNLEM